MWYIWSSDKSPVFGKEKMATFEKYLVDDKEIQYEKKDCYYELSDNEDIVNKILEEFGLDTNTSHIINGHVTVELKNGEMPIRCGGKLLMIDGGFSRAHQNKTGIAGYTLIYNSMVLRLVSHEHFESAEKAIVEETDIYSDVTVVEQAVKRLLVGDTDN